MALMKLILKTFVLILIICGLISTVHYCSRVVVEKRPELNIISQYLIENAELRKSVENYVGEITSIEYQPRGSSVRNYFGKPLVEGVYFFDVEGTKGSKIIRVTWRSSGDGNDCEVLKLEEGMIY